MKDFKFEAIKTISMEDAVRLVEDAIMRGEKLSEQLEEANNLFLKIQNKIENEPEEETMTETRIYGLIDDYLTKWVGKDWWTKNEFE